MRMQQQMAATNATHKIMRLFHGRVNESERAEVYWQVYDFVLDVVEWYQWAVEKEGARLKPIPNGEDR